MCITTQVLSIVLIGTCYMSNYRPSKNIRLQNMICSLERTFYLLVLAWAKVQLEQFELNKNPRKEAPYCCFD